MMELARREFLHLAAGAADRLADRDLADLIAADIGTWATVNKFSGAKAE